nr:MAG TPA: hypothetical protein [Caudoviricetes sp.]
MISYEIIFYKWVKNSYDINCKILRKKFFLPHF